MAATASIAAIGASAAGAASSINSMVSGPPSGTGGGSYAGGGGGGYPGVYQPQAQGQMDQYFQQGIPSAISNFNSFNVPFGQAANSLTNNVVNNPYYNQMQGNANTLGGQYVQAGQQAYGAGQGMFGQSQNLYDTGASIAGLLGTQANYQLGNFAGAANNIYGGLTGEAGQVLNAANDPRQALYNRTQQQVMDQQNAILAQQGLGGSPYAAGVAGQTASNFNIDWQNQQLQRSLAGAQAYGGLMGEAGQAYGSLYGQGVQNYGNLYSQGAQAFGGLAQAGQRAGATAADLSSAGLGLQNFGNQLPYNTYLGQQQAALGGIQSGTSAIQGINSLYPFNALESYLGLGQSASATGASNANMSNAFSNQQAAQLGQALSGLGNLSGVFGGGGGGYSGGYNASPYMLGQTDPYAINSGNMFNGFSAGPV